MTVGDKVLVAAAVAGLIAMLAIAGAAALVAAAVILAAYGAGRLLARIRRFLVPRETDAEWRRRWGRAPGDGSTMESRHEAYMAARRGNVVSLEEARRQQNLRRLMARKPPWE